MRQTGKSESWYLRQKHLLDTFLVHGAISRAQYEKSLGDLTEKMGMEKERETNKIVHAVDHLTVGF